MRQSCFQFQILVSSKITTGLIASKTIQNNFTKRYQFMVKMYIFTSTNLKTLPKEFVAPSQRELAETVKRKIHFFSITKVLFKQIYLVLSIINKLVSKSGSWFNVVHLVPVLVACVFVPIYTCPLIGWLKYKRKFIDSVFLSLYTS